MAVQKKIYTVTEFDEFAELPENAEQILEFIGGKIVEVPSNPYSSMIAMGVALRIGNHVEKYDLGFVTGQAGGYMVMNERYVPDVAFISKERQPELARKGYNPNPPNLAVEVEFPTSVETERRLRKKIVSYWTSGTLSWVVYPEWKEVEVYVPSQPMKKLRIDDTLDGGDVLPGFELPVREIFPK